MTTAVCEVTGSAVGLDVFLDEFDGFVDRLIDQLAPVRFSVPAGAAGSDGPAPPACISVPAATDVDADIDRDATGSHHGEGRTLFQLLDAPAGVVDEPRLLAVLKTGVAGACHSNCVSPEWSIIGPPFGRAEGVFCEQDHAGVGGREVGGTTVG